LNYDAALSLLEAGELELPVVVDASFGEVVDTEAVLDEAVVVDEDAVLDEPELL